MIDVHKLRKDFPILEKKIHGKPLVYLDNAATTQKPKMVLDEIIEFYSSINSNIHRGVHYLSEQASIAYENARKTVKGFLNAKSDYEIVFTSGTTQAINLVANSFGSKFIEEGDEIIVSEMEHHSNIVPWQILCERTQAELKVAPFDDDGKLMMDELKGLITEKTKLIAIVYVSNALGVVNPIKEIIEMAHTQDIPVLIDGAQAVQHFPVDVQELDCDFFAFSGHKMYAETGIGVLYGKEKWLEDMPPHHSGGGMVDSVTFEKTTYADLPFKFEAGTGNYVAAVSLAKAIEYISKLSMMEITIYENDLLKYATEKLDAIDGLMIYGLAPKRCGLISFNLDNIHPYDVGMILDKLGIAIRTGTHCAEPVMEHFGINATIRASFAFYNTKEEIDKLIDGMHKARVMLCK
ncbi:MAG: cysteine desulfurase [Candidatus Aminicenantes bacterium]|nr:MAG: cysteine desulfurase [Candidatus Aminicenantes bacterium]